MINILITDDSPTDAAILKLIFESEPDMKVIGWAHNGIEALQMTEQLKPDLITMDIKMPLMDGLQATEEIMSQFPTPIVIISSLIGDADADSEATFKALEVGALTVLPKPVDVQSKLFQIRKRHMTDVIRSMAEIKPIRRRRLTSQTPLQKFNALTHGDFRVIVIGASVGGPQVLKDVLSRLPANFPVPIVAVQHMTQGFILGFIKWLDSHVGLTVKHPEDGELLKPGVVYFAPDDFHFEIKQNHGALSASLVKGETVSGFCPSITHLMKSASQHCGKNVVGVLLTGMGSDGAEGMLALKKSGAHTIAQDPDSCVVFGMGNVANTMGAVDKIVKLDKLAEYLIMITNRKSKL